LTPKPPTGPSKSASPPQSANASVDGDIISIAILPLTYWRTNLHTLAPGAPLNVEADVLVKLAWQQMQDRAKSGPGPESKSEATPEFELTESWLVANGY
jgi:riboflavin synthase